MRWQRATRPFSSALQVRLPGLFQGNAFEKVCRRRATHRVRTRASDHPANHVSPSRKKLQHCAGAFAKKHSCADIRTKRGNELSRSAQTSLSAADVHDSRD